MIITPTELSAFVSCPRRYRLLKKAGRAFSPPVLKNCSVITQIMQKAHVWKMSAGYPAKWPQMVGWFSKYWFKDVDINNDTVFAAEKQEMERALVFTHKWYNTDYVADSIGYSSIRLSKDILDYTVEETIPLLILEPQPIVVEVSEMTTSIGQLKRSMDVRIVLWLILSSVDTEKATWRRMTITPEGSAHINQFSMTKGTAKRTKFIVKQALSSLYRGVEYPSIGEQCSTCRCGDRCII